LRLLGRQRFLEMIPSALLCKRPQAPWPVALFERFIIGRMIPERMSD
jgi:hypothetical protein